MVTFLLIFIYLLSSSSNASSIVKNLPGFNGDLPFTLETGYVGVGEDDEVQLFYYFVESQRDPFHDPLIFYLPGGPGTTGLYDVIYQIGPLLITPHGSFTALEEFTLELNPNSWAKTANVIMLDVPAGTGFSYSTTYEASKSSDTILAQHTYEFIVKWLEEHPGFLSNPLYVGGISYVGILIPLVTLKLYKGNEHGHQPKLNIKGYIILSPLADKFIDFNSRIKFAHRFALISDDIYKSTKEACQGNYVYNDPENIECSKHLQRVYECTCRINEEYILDPYCDAVNPDPSCRHYIADYMDFYGNNKEVRKALHIREGTVNKFVNTNETIHYRYKKKDSECYSYDMFSSIVHHKSLIAKNCQVLILSADHDFTFSSVGTEKWIKSLNLPIESPWKPWFINTQVGGYKMKYAKNKYSLTYATIKGAGHSIPLYKPEEVWVVLDGWLASHAYLSDL